jgi:ABC-type xylose transport system permease subunit
MRRYLTLGFVQFILIFISGWLRRDSWKEIDFSWEAWPSSVQLSFCFLAGWLATIVIAMWFALVDKRGRSMVVLFLILLLPWMEFFVWFALSF